MTFSQASLRNGKRQILFLLLVVIAVYLPAVSDSVNSIDDGGILKFYGNDRLTFLDAIRPGGGYYYRPVTALTFLLDYRLFAQTPALLHLENVLIHAANAVVLFLFASRLFPAAAAGLPLGAALLFALHPVNCEAVSWIAGRTDPLAALFVLLSGLSLVKGLDTGKLRYGLLSVALACLGVLSKETAVVFIPASLLVAHLWPRINPAASPDQARRLFKLLGLLYACIALVIAGYVLYRIGYQHNSVARLLRAQRLEPLGALLAALKIAGFYLKKLFVPWPLNFAITSVPAWYAAFGAAALLALCALPKKDVRFLCVLIGVLFLAPAVAVGLLDIAWTTVAERYLYLPSAFVSLGIAGYAGLWAERVRRQGIVAAVAVACIALAGVSTASRALVWRSNLTLFRDAVAKTPDFPILHNELAVALMQEGWLAEAEKELDVAASLKTTELVRGLVRGNRLLIRMKTASQEERRRILNEAAPVKSEETTELLLLLRKTDYNILRNIPKGPGRDALIAELIEVSGILFRRTGDPLILYNNGQLFLDRGERGRAAECFRESYRLAPEGAHYKVPARRLAEKLSGQTL